MEKTSRKRKISSDLFQAAAALETELESHSSSEEEDFQPHYTPTPIPSPKNSNLYLLSNRCLDSAFSQGTILVQVEQTTTLYPFKPAQVNSQILFGNLSNFVIFFKASSKLSIPAVVFQRPNFFLKPIKSEKFTIQLINQSKEPIQLLKGTSLGHLFLYPHFKPKW